MRLISDLKPLSIILINKEDFPLTVLRKLWCSRNYTRVSHFLNILVDNIGNN